MLRFTRPTAIGALLGEQNCLRVRENLLCERSCIAFVNLVDDAHFLGQLEAERTTGYDQLDRLGFSDQAREPLGSAGSGQHAETDFRKPDLSAVAARDPNIAGHRDLEPAADGVSVERGDHELRRLLETRQRLVGVQAEVVLELRRDRVQHSDVCAGGEEALAFAGEDDDFDAVVETRVENCFIELPHHLMRVGVCRRIIHRDDRDVPVLCIGDDALCRYIRGVRDRRVSVRPFSYRSPCSALVCPSFRCDPIRIFEQLGQTRFVIGHR